MRWRALAVVGLVGASAAAGCSSTSSARQTCEDAVRKEYADADKVLQQPLDLNGYCATWNDNPPGIGP